MPSVFVSATSRDLRSYRHVVAEWARQHGYAVVVQDEFPVQPDHGTIVQMLRDKIAPCDAVIHLAGLFYGFEPTNRPDGELRRSYTQLEYELGRELNRPVFRFLARGDYRPDQPFTQTDEQRDLQLRHRQRLTAGSEPYAPTARTTGNEPYYEFSTHDELRQLLAKVAILPTVTKPTNLPFPSLGTLFKGRDEFLGHLRRVLVSRPTAIAAVTAKQAIHGLGGIGKTRLAVEYGWKHQHEYTALLFVSADTPEGLHAQLAALCGALVLNLPEQHAREQAVQIGAALRWLREHAGWFLVVDNVDTPEAQAAVERVLTQLSSGHVVITSRLAQWQGQVETLALDVLAEEAAAAFLLERTQGKRRAAATDEADARQLARDLDGLALALEQAGAYVEKHRLRLQEYRQRWRQQEAKVLEWFDAGRMKYPRSVAVTWQTSFERAGDDGRALLNVLCWLAPDPIPRAMLARLPTREGEPAIDVETALGNLADYSLVRWTADNEGVVVHKLVQEIARYRLPEAVREGWFKRALGMVNGFVEGDPQDVRTWKGIYEPAAPHGLAVTDHAERFGNPEPTGRLLNKLGLFFSGKAAFAEAEPLYRRAWAIEEASFGPDHPTVATTLNNLAGLLADTNRLAKGAPLYRRALAIWEANYGPDHPQVALACNNLGGIWRTTGRLEEAEALFRRALAIYEASYGPDHPDVARGLNNLAELLEAADHLTEAEPLYERGLRILLLFQQRTGYQHPDFEIAVGNYYRFLTDDRNLTPEDAEDRIRRLLDPIQE